MSRFVALLVAALLVGGCAGSPNPAAPTTSSSATPKADDYAPEALSDFRCGWAGAGWVAKGILSNATKASVSYQVTVYVGDAGSSGTGTTQRYEHIAAGGSIPFTIDKIPATGETGTCHVRVLTVR